MLTKLMLITAMLPLVAGILNNVPTRFDSAPASFHDASIVDGQYPQLGEGATLDESINSGAFSYTGE